MMSYLKKKKEKKWLISLIRAVCVESLDKKLPKSAKKNSQDDAVFDIGVI